MPKHNRKAFVLCGHRTEFMNTDELRRCILHMEKEIEELRKERNFFMLGCAKMKSFWDQQFSSKQKAQIRELEMEHYRINNFTDGDQTFNLIEKQAQSYANESDDIGESNLDESNKSALTIWIKNLEKKKIEKQDSESEMDVEHNKELISSCPQCCDMHRALNSKRAAQSFQESKVDLFTGEENAVSTRSHITKAHISNTGSLHELIPQGFKTSMENNNRYIDKNRESVSKILQENKKEVPQIQCPTTKGSALKMQISDNLNVRELKTEVTEKSIDSYKYLAYKIRESGAQILRENKTQFSKIPILTATSCVSRIPTPDISKSLKIQQIVKTSTNNRKSYESLGLDAQNSQKYIQKSKIPPAKNPISSSKNNIPKVPYCNSAKLWDLESQVVKRPSCNLESKAKGDFDIQSLRTNKADISIKSTSVTHESCIEKKQKYFKHIFAAKFLELISNLDELKTIKKSKEEAVTSLKKIIHENYRIRQIEDKVNTLVHKLVNREKDKLFISLAIKCLSRHTQEIKMLKYAYDKIKLDLDLQRSQRRDLSKRLACDNQNLQEKQIKEEQLVSLLSLVKSKEKLALKQ